MRGRIKLIMEEEKLTPSAFADRLGIGRAVMSHILNGRNNPSLDVVTRILERIIYVDADWLLFGIGNMHRQESVVSTMTPIEDNSNISSSTSASLFEEQETKEEIQQNSILLSEDNIEEQLPKERSVDTVSKIEIATSSTSKTITKLIIYYSDNTFQSLNAVESGF